MKGTIDEPEVSINPLMALAPGIFRKIFGAIGGSDSSPTAREEAENQDNIGSEPPASIEKPIN